MNTRSWPDPSPIVFVFLLLLLLPSTSDAGSHTGTVGTKGWDCFDSTFCIRAEQIDGVVHIFVKSLASWDFSLSLEMQLENLASDRELPVVNTYSPGSEIMAINLRIIESGKPWSYRYDFKWLPGRIDAVHDDAYTYALPYARGRTYLVGQAFDGQTTHSGRNAIDWDLAMNTGVRAARGGVVIDVEESYTEGGVDPALKPRANSVTIRHDDGTIGTYVHLRNNGVRVVAGDRVNRGELIAWSGNTGFSSGPHLHFEVYTLTSELDRKTIPIRFHTRDQASVILQEGVYYEH
jgi:murein DD-endopeptidase MepM/ murein hydrolase activator NlpD